MNKLLLLLLPVLAINGLTMTNQSYNGLTYFGSFKSGQYKLRITLLSTKPITIAFFPSNKLKEFKQISLTNSTGSIIKLTTEVKTIVWNSMNITYTPKQHYANVKWFIGMIPQDNTTITIDGEIRIITSDALYKNSVLFAVMYTMMVILTLMTILPRAYTLYHALNGQRRYDLNWW